jgi:hypothetical protein
MYKCIFNICYELSRHMIFGGVCVCVWPGKNKNWSRNPSFTAICMCHIHIVRGVVWMACELDIAAPSWLSFYLPHFLVKSLFSRGREPTIAIFSCDHGLMYLMLCTSKRCHRPLRCRCKMMQTDCRRSQYIHIYMYVGWWIAQSSTWWKNNNT